MQLELPVKGLENYHSPTQRARVATEGWAVEHLFCVNCDSPRLTPLPRNARAVDFECPACGDPFQLKGQSRPFVNRVTDAAYKAMMEAIAADRTPHLLLLHYEAAFWKVRNLFLIPRFAFSASAIEKRKPLGKSARRAGWVGCNILLTKIPSDARVTIISDGIAEKASSVRRDFGRLRPLSRLSTAKRGWTLDVLNAVRSLGKRDLLLSDIYSLEASLARLHTSNRHIREKIRQQLQVLRDMGLLEFAGRGQYRLR